MDLLAKSAHPATSRQFLPDPFQFPLWDQDNRAATYNARSTQNCYQRHFPRDLLPGHYPRSLTWTLRLRWRLPWRVLRGGVAVVAAQDHAAEVFLIKPVGLVGFPTPLIGIALENLGVQPSHVVTALDEALGQVIEQCAVAGWVGQVHVIGRGNNAASKIVGPQSVHKSVGEIGILRIAQPIH